MTSILDTTTIGRPQRPRRHVRSLTGTSSRDTAASLSNLALFQVTFQRRMIPEKKNGPEARRKCGGMAIGSSIRVSDRRNPIRVWWPLVSCHEDIRSLTRSFVNHVQTSLARQVYSLDDLGAYQATALSVRDNLLVGVCHDKCSLGFQTIFVPDQLECHTIAFESHRGETYLLSLPRIPDGSGPRQCTPQSWT